jgi:hypothetical protein
MVEYFSKPIAAPIPSVSAGAGNTVLHYFLESAVRNPTFSAMTDTGGLQILRAGGDVSEGTMDFEIGEEYNPVLEGSDCSISVAKNLSLPMPPSSQADIDMLIYNSLNLLYPMDLAVFSSPNPHDAHSYDTPAFNMARSLSEMDWPFACQSHEGYLEMFPEADRSVSMDQPLSGSDTNRTIDNQIFGFSQSLSDSQFFPETNSLNPLPTLTNTEQCPDLWAQAYSVSRIPCTANIPLVPDMLCNLEPDNLSGSGFGRPNSSAMCLGSPSIDCGGCSADGHFSMQDHSPLQGYSPLQEYSSPQDSNIVPSWTPRLPGNIDQFTRTIWPNPHTENAPITVDHSFAAAGSAYNWQDSSSDCHSVARSPAVALNANSSSSRRCLNQTRNPTSKRPQNIYGSTGSPTMRTFFGGNSIQSRYLQERSTKGIVRGCYGPEKRRKVASVRNVGACILCRINKVEVDKMSCLWIFLLLIKRSVQSSEHVRRAR